MFYIYVLHSKRDFGLYIGYSTDFRRRLAEHKEGASQATSQYIRFLRVRFVVNQIPWTAIARERYLKSGGGRKFLRS
jgi:putative endonuclease